MRFVFFLMVMVIAMKCFSQIRITRLNGSLISQDSLTKSVAALIDKANVTGMEIAIYNRKKAVFEKAYGLANAKTGKTLNVSSNMYGASLSKAVFAVIVLKLVDEKLISLDTPLQNYLPRPIYEYEHKVWHEDFSALRDDPRYKKITARMCLSHTTGFPNWRWFEPDQKLRIRFEPGSKYSYSGEGLVYLQVVIERMTNKSLEDIAREKLFLPLGMNSSSYKWQEQYEADYASGHDSAGKVYPKDKDNAPRGPSTLETTLDDYSKFVTAVLNRKIISAASYKEMFRPQIRIRSKSQFGPMSETEGDWNDKIELSYGLGWGLLKSPYGWAAFKEGHGDGFQHYSILFFEKGTGMVIMSNSDNAEGIFKYLLEQCIGDMYTPWQWEYYIPFDQKK
ncbi:serine hydrolase domain-containing protein [Pollutibacter soli]|uniref:serine hydrolase domain-containing protein n=1 Tax=Pollutibacter soli TaxID=3034157 RepID=UPI003013CA60